MAPVRRTDRSQIPASSASDGALRCGLERRSVGGGLGRIALLTQPVAVGGTEIQAVHAFELGDFVESRRLERWLVLQSVQRDAFQQIAERDIQVLRKALENLQEAFFEPYTGLNTLDFTQRRLLPGFRGGHGIPISGLTRAASIAHLPAAPDIGTLVPMYQPPLTQVHSFHLDVPLQRAFPLFTALGERAWAPGWDPVMLSGKEERGSTFRTRNHHGEETTWIVTDYRPAEGRVSYARLAHDSNIGLVDVICTEPRGGGTDVSVRYTLTGVSTHGQKFVRDFLYHDRYVQMIEEWRAAVVAALAESPKSELRFHPINEMRAD
jgi:hypothetical protein